MSRTRAVVNIREAAAVERLLHVLLHGLRFVPSSLQQLVLLVFIQSQTCTGDGKLQHEHYEEDHHVEEEKDLVVLQGSAQPHEGNQQQEGAHPDDPRHHTDAGDQAEPLPPGCHPDQQQTHHNIEDIERRKCVLGANKPPADHGRSVRTLSSDSRVRSAPAARCVTPDAVGPLQVETSQLPALRLRADLSQCSFTYDSFLIPHAGD